MLVEVITGTVWADGKRYNAKSGQVELDKSEAERLEKIGVVKIVTQEAKPAKKPGRPKKDS